MFSNTAGLEAIDEVFELRDAFELRGLGPIDHSGVRIRDSYADFDTERKFEVPNLRVVDPRTCQCGEVLKGQIRPWECQLFGSECTPQSPMGALMVSSEGSCAAYYNYGNLDELLQNREQQAAGS